MLLNGILFDNRPEYAAKLESGVLIVGFDDGTATGSDGKTYRHIMKFDSDENVIADGWITDE